MNFKRATKGVFLSFVFMLLFAYVISGSQWLLNNFFTGAKPAQFLGSVSNGVQSLADQNNMQQAMSFEIEAESAISARSSLDSFQVVFDKNISRQLPIASLTKLMTAIVVLDNYNLGQEITVNKAADEQAAIKEDVKLGDTMPMQSFFELMLIGSSNKSAYVLSEFIGTEKFVGLMNQKAKEIGLQNTSFAEPTGLSSKNVSTARDLAKLAEYILNNYPKIAEITRTKELYVAKFGLAKNTDQLLEEIPEIVFGKTGFTLEAKGCLVLALKNAQDNSYSINVILGAEDRFLEMKKIISAFNN